MENEQGHPLNLLTGLTEEGREALADLWILTVEELLGRVATAEARAGLGALLGLDEEGLRALLDEAAALVGEEEALRLTTPAEPPGATGLIFTPGERAGLEARQAELDAHRAPPGEEEE